MHERQREKVQTDFSWPTIVAYGFLFFRLHDAHADDDDDDDDDDGVLCWHHILVELGDVLPNSEKKRETDSQ